MKHTVFFSFLIVIGFITLNSFNTQFNEVNANAAMPIDTNKTVILTSNFITYFGCTDTMATITKAKFLSAIAKPICVRDKSNKTYPIKSFQILYAERGLYLDSNDAPIIITDYTEESFKGDSITSMWKDLFKNRLFKGDTVFFENIVITTESKNFKARRLKMAIVE